MHVLVTGATGLVGNAIAKKLVAAGDDVRVLARNPAAAEKLVPGARVLGGDVTDPASLAPAVQGAELVFHAAGMPEQWQKDDSVFDRVNRGGTRHVLEAARDAGVRRVVFTSTMDVFEAPRGGTVVETRVDPAPKHTAYERSKQAAEKEADRIRATGLDVVFVNPAAVYGPSPVHVALNSFFVRLLKKQVPMCPPGGMSVAYVDGVADAHIAAAEKGKSGERYLVADTFVTNRELAELVAREANLPRVPPTAPAWLLWALAHASAPLARTFGFTPLIAPGQLTFLLWSARVDASKAARELGFTSTPVEEGVRKTIEFLKKEGVA